MIDKRRIVGNILSNWTSYLVTVVVTFFLSPFIVNTLGKSSYGIWVLVSSLTGYFGILDLGMRPAMVRFIANHKALNEEEKINEVINTSLAVFLTIGALVLVISVILSLLSPHLFAVESERHDILQVVIVLIGLKIALDFPFGVFHAVFNGFQRFDINNMLMISVFLVRALMIVLLLKQGGGILALAVIVLGAGIVEGILKVAFARRIFPGLTISPRFARRSMLKTIFNFSIYTFMIGISAQFVLYTDNVIIGTVISASAVTFFAIGANLIEYLKILVNQFTMSLSPVASELGAVNDMERLRKLLLAGTRYCLLLVLPVGLVYILHGKSFITLWMGPQFGTPSSTVLTILMVSYFGFLSQLVSGGILLGMGRIKLLAWVLLTMALIIIGLSLVLVRTMGIYGVALATTIPQTIYGTLFLPVYICRVLGVNVWDYFRRSFLPPLVCAVPFLLVLLLYRRYIQFDSLTEFFLWIAAATLLFAVPAFFICVEKQLRQRVLEKIRVR